MFFIVASILVIALLAYNYRDSIISLVRKAPAEIKNAELLRVLLDLEEEPLNELFELYKSEFGSGPARYARRTYGKWRSRTVRPNRQTFNRFLLFLPKVMSFELKCEVLRKLRQEFCPKDHYEVAVYTDDWKETLAPVVKGAIEKARTAELPSELSEKLMWLSEGETQIANAMLAESQARSSENVLTLLDQEFANIDHLLLTMNGKGKVEHIIDVPYGTITVKIKRR
jgi:hypothetical protein